MEIVGPQYDFLGIMKLILLKKASDSRFMHRYLRLISECLGKTGISYRGHITFNKLLTDMIDRAVSSWS